MKPTPQHPERRRELARSVSAGCLGVLLLAALFLPSHNPATQSLAVEWRPSAQLAGLLFVLGAAALALPRLVAARGLAFALALLVAGAALLNLADAVVPTLFGRDLNLYWDLPHLPSLVGLAREAAGVWTVLAAAAVLLLALVLLIAVCYWAWRRVLLALSDRRVATGTAVLLGAALSLTAFAVRQGPLANGFGRDIVRHAAAVEHAWRTPVDAAALASAAPPSGDLAGLKQHDVYVVFIESYGTTVYDTPEFRAQLSEPLARFEATLRRSGYAVASNRLVSPTFGGGSWLAHATLASGVRLNDPVLYSRLLSSGRKLLPGYLEGAGWRTVDVMPGMKKPPPEARAWGFDRDVYAAQLGYHGPAFGWFDIPDQFTLDRATAIRSTLGSTPVFMQIVLVSSHAPFSPVPPYLSDWRDAGSFTTIPAADWKQIYRPPDWTRLAPGYLKSLRYDFAVLGDWLAEHLPGDGLIILLGDHQPPLVGGEDQQWTVPIHVLSRDPALVAPFIAAGYVAGLAPPATPSPAGMEEFLPRFLAAFDRSGPKQPNASPRKRAEGAVGHSQGSNQRGQP
ncbi:MAG: hypothetical protein J2P48_04460 [Alphaproteobacteria bacterium]|nr:hypothetical protein [Alphaproteobacteria bacterium]